MKRVVMIGSESTGKTSLATKLSLHFSAPWAPEFARLYADAVGRDLTTMDVEPIARGVISMHDEIETTRPPMIILDTDLFSTVVYGRHYYGEAPPWIETEALKRKSDLYLLLDTDIPFVHDPTQRGTEEQREALQLDFREIIELHDLRYELITGDGSVRLQRAISVMKSFQGPGLRKP